MEKQPKLIRLIVLFALMVLNHAVHGQGIIGQWITFDDETNKEKAVVEIYKTSDTYFARIAENFVGEEDAICEVCKGDKKNNPIIGLVIIENMEMNGDGFDGGSILDPETGETYKCYLKLINDKELKVRGFIGFSILGRTQYWLRKD
ncbi:MAG: DUF2147 domain-containing protein [Cyclobacteriaceae bacterium]